MGFGGILVLGFRRGEGGVAGDMGVEVEGVSFCVLAGRGV